MNDRVAIVSIKRMGRSPLRSDSDQDLVAVEAPVLVELHQAARSGSRSLGVLMRTPGDDRDLILGLLYTEGMIRSIDDVLAVEARSGVAATSGGEAERPADEVIDVHLADDVELDAGATDRALLSTSACGLCGRLAVRGLDVLVGRALARDRPTLLSATVAGLPAALRKGQAVFEATGGLHAAGLFDATGQLLAIREDVGRHNAVDKLVGAALAAGWLPARDAVLAVSGRVAFEIVQKTVMAGVPALVAVGAPSSLAVDAARAANLTLIGFVRDGRFNVYSGIERIDLR